MSKPPYLTRTDMLPAVEKFAEECRQAGNIALPLFERTFGVRDFSFDVRSLPSKKIEIIYEELMSEDED